MSRPAKRTPERKLQVVLSVLRGEVSAVEAARRAGVTEQTVHNWRSAFLEAGREGSRWAEAVPVVAGARARGRERGAEGRAE